MRKVNRISKGSIAQERRSLSSFAYRIEQKQQTVNIITFFDRMTGLVVGAPQTFRYFQRIQEQITEFVTANSKISKKEFERYMMATGEMATDVGTILYGKEAVSSGLIDRRY